MHGGYISNGSNFFQNKWFTIVLSGLVEYNQLGQAAASR